MSKYLSSSVHAIRGNGRYGAWKALDEVPEEEEEEPAQPLLRIGREAARLDPSVLRQLRHYWAQGEQSEKDLWKWLVSYGVEELFMVELEGRSENLGMGVRVCMLRRRPSKYARPELVIATLGDLAFEFVPQWRARG